MKRFRFKLDKLLGYRPGRLRQAQGRYGAALAEVVEVERHITEMQRAREEHKRLLRAQSTGVLSRNEAIATRLFLDRTWLAILRRQADLRQTQESAEVVRAELTEARREVRVLELLRERRHTDWRRTADREETRDLDEVGSRAGFSTSPWSPSALLSEEATDAG